MDNGQWTGGVSVITCWVEKVPSTGSFVVSPSTATLAHRWLASAKTSSCNSCGAYERHTLYNSW